MMEDAELIRERIATTVTSLLGLTGITPIPFKAVNLSCFLPSLTISGGRGAIWTWHN
jgi:hypothetical protein